jgi:diguanylate cyclase (GGDEF)-like protein
MRPPPPLPPAPVVILLGVAIAATGWIDYLTGPELGFSLFYLIPVAGAGWWLGLRSGVAIAGAAAVAWLAADAAWHPLGHLPISAWNGFTRLVIFVFGAIATSRLRDDREQLLDLNERLRELLEREQVLARTDSLTQLANARAFHERLASELPRIRRRRDRLCVVYLDIDNFKQVNDRFGHAGGDELLRQVAALIRLAIRAGDMAARIGGDEFALALWESEPEAAAGIASRLALRVEDLRADYPGVELGSSVGIAHFAEAPASVEDALRRADAAMYAAKAAGKGGVAIVGEEGAPVVLRQANAGREA